MKKILKRSKNSEGRLFGRFAHLRASWPLRLHIFMQALSPAHKKWRYLKRCNKFGWRLFVDLLAFQVSHFYAGDVASAQIPCRQWTTAKKMQREHLSVEFLAFSRRMLSKSFLNNSAKVVFVAIMIMNYTKNDEATCQQVFIHIMLPCAQSLQKKFLMWVSFLLNTSSFFPCSETCC